MLTSGIWRARKCRASLRTPHSVGVPANNMHPGNNVVGLLTGKINCCGPRLVFSADRCLTLAVPGELVSVLGGR